MVLVYIKKVGYCVQLIIYLRPVLGFPKLSCLFLMLKQVFQMIGLQQRFCWKLP